MSLVEPVGHRCIRHLGLRHRELLALDLLAGVAVVVEHVGERAFAVIAVSHTTCHLTSHWPKEQPGELRANTRGPLPRRGAELPRFPVVVVARGDHVADPAKERISH